MRRPLLTALTMISLLIVSACGFKPIYATPQGKSAPLSQLVTIGAIKAPDTVRLQITEALNDRISLKDGETPEYELIVAVKETAQQLAVQIDATVTRYNYRLNANYTLVDLKTGERINGKAQAVTSYNIVSSQYSTLFAERTATEKAARLLSEEIERDLLIRFSEGLLALPDPEPYIQPDLDGDLELIGGAENTTEPTDVWQQQK
ncbi:MAG: hypothetical protein DHS20C05_17530 [Hyphococcus sp.]|nr:MAG: hypothetical protein DHS20C05_17530 [Marinicaulis sp.]